MTHSVLEAMNEPALRHHYLQNGERNDLLLAHSLRSSCYQTSPSFSPSSTFNTLQVKNPSHLSPSTIPETILK